jgi:signal transduction histidine kinase
VGKLELDDVLDGLVREAHQLMDCHICALLLLNPDGRSLRLHSMVGPEGPLAYDENLSIDDSSVGAAVHRCKQVEVTNLPFTEEHHFIRIIQRENLASMLATPIVFNDAVIGALNIYTRRQRRFNNDEKKVVAALATLGAAAIQNARLYARVFSSEESLRRNEKLTTLGMLAAEIAHEIRNPLTVLKLLFDSLELRFDPDDPRHKDTEVIGEKLDQLEEIVERVLGFGRSREGMHARYELGPLVEETLRLVRLKLHQQKIAIDYRPWPDSLRVEVNKGQIQQVILNLLLNATQIMSGGGHIRIETAPEEDRVLFTISDDGGGIPPEVQPQIFDSFLTQRSEGTGLGLSISKRILRAHRGDIELVDSGPGGTTFRFWLPRA